MGVSCCCTVDKRDDGVSKESSGRVCMYKQLGTCIVLCVLGCAIGLCYAHWCSELLLLGVVKSYTLECNYNDGPYVNDVRSLSSLSSLTSLTAVDCRCHLLSQWRKGPPPSEDQPHTTPATLLMWAKAWRWLA